MSNDKRDKILIVDDERTNINMLTQILKSQYTVYIAKDGSSAIQVARANLPDLILLDVVMPGLSGFEVLSELKTMETTKQIPVIFITGRDNAEDEETGLSLGAVDYISKPFHNSIVLARVKTHLQINEYIKTIEHLSLVDPLTELPNRRSFDNRLNREWNRAIREQTPLSLLIIDIDRFKHYNDRYGHKQGDVLLRELGILLQESLRRPGDFVARWGGEEFAALLPNTDITGGLKVAERIRSSAENMETAKSHLILNSVTVSIGVNTIVPSVGQSYDEFFTATDRALYNAKDSGRNQIQAVQALSDEP